MTSLWGVNNALFTSIIFIKAHVVPLLLIFLVLHLLYNKYGHGINHIPGPTLAAWTRLWRFVDVAYGHGHLTVLKLHRNHGKLVRTAPNVVDVGDTAMIPVIYNIKGNYTKVNPLEHKSGH